MITGPFSNFRFLARFQACLRALPLILAATFFAATATAAIPIPAAPTISAKGYILVDHASGREISASNPDERLAPASITKLMTSLVAFRELKQGSISLDDEVTISEKAWRMTGSRMFIEVNTRVRVDDLMRGMIVQSGNDASVALAEHIAGSEESFAHMMNDYAVALEMTDSHFMNSTGLPAENHYTTARDIARLSRALIRDYPDYYRWYAEKNFTFNDIPQRNRNTLLWRDPTVDGLKTGHTEAAGYCLAASAQRDGTRLIAVVMGARSSSSRADAAQSLLNYGFRFFETHVLYEAGSTLTTARVWKGTQEQVPVGLTEALHVTIPRGRYDQLEATMDLRNRILAPVAIGESLGEVRVMLDDEVLATRPLYPLEDVAVGSLWRRAVDEVALWFE